MNKIPFKRILLYIILALLGMFVIYLFVTAKTYTQLGFAVISYPILAFLIIKAIPKRTRKALSSVVVQKPYDQTVIQPAVQPAMQTAVIGVEDVADIDKRTFLKLVGATGIFFFVTSLVGKWLGTIPFSSSAPPLSGLSGNDSANVAASPDGEGGFSTNGYTITEIDEGLVSYYGFTNKSGGWLIMKEDSDTSSFRYAKGDASFPTNWKNRSTLKYDYYYNLQ